MASATNFSKKSINFITGASKGIGQTIAVELSKHLSQDSILVVFARSQSGLDDTKKHIEEVDKSLMVLTYVLDLSKPDVDNYNAIFREILGKVDSKGIELGTIFHNAGYVGALKETTELNNLQEWREYFDLNLFSTVLLNNVFIKQVRSIAPHLLVVNVTSVCGRNPFVNLSMYGTGKASREIFFKVLALEEKNVIVLNYSPGPVKTDMFDSICDTAQNAELRNTFNEVRQKSVLTPVQTVSKMLEILEKGDYESGATIDYFDRI